MEKIVYQGRIIEVVEKEVEQNGRNKTFEFARRSPGVRLIIQKDQQVLLTREYRHELGSYDYRLPGGKVYDSLGEYNDALDAGVDIQEVAKQAAIKEAREETGIRITDLSFVHRSICGATVVWDLFYFFAESFEIQQQELEDGEDITFGFFNFDKAREMCLDGSFSEERSALVLLKHLNQ
jgi:ADP-ribose pyrophosphatase